MLLEGDDGQDMQAGRGEDNNGVDDKLISTDPVAPTKEIRKVKSVEKVHLYQQTLNEEFGKFKRTLSSYHVSNVPVNDIGTNALTNETITNITKNEPVKLVSHATDETTSSGQERSEQKLLQVISD